jgi:SAM-dependent methyltransferase
MSSKSKSTCVTPLLHRLPGLLDQFHGHSRQTPEVREDEFFHLFETADMLNPGCILEFLAENAEVANRYPDAHVKTVDLFVTESMKNRGVTETDWALSGIDNRSIDLIVSLAPIHHATDEEQLTWFKACNRVLRQGGVLAFAEIDHGSNLHRFLDGFVDAHTPTGHTGNYLKDDMVSTLKAAGFVEVKTHLHQTSWKFSNLQHMGNFLASALAIQHSPEAIVDAAIGELGVRHEEESVVLNWPLRYVRASKTEI